jgi:hypothetical protein
MSSSPLPPPPPPPSPQQQAHPPPPQSMMHKRRCALNMLQSVGVFGAQADKSMRLWSLAQEHMQKTREEAEADEEAERLQLRTPHERFLQQREHQKAQSYRSWTLDAVQNVELSAEPRPSAPVLTASQRKRAAKANAAKKVKDLPTTDQEVRMHFREMNALKRKEAETRRRLEAEQKARLKNHLALHRVELDEHANVLVQQLKEWEGMTPEWHEKRLARRAAYLQECIIELSEKLFDFAFDATKHLTRAVLVVSVPSESIWSRLRAWQITNISVNTQEQIDVKVKTALAVKDEHNTQAYKRVQSELLSYDPQREVCIMLVVDCDPTSVAEAKQQKGVFTQLVQTFVCPRYLNKSLDVFIAHQPPSAGTYVGRSGLLRPPLCAYCGWPIINMETPGMEERTGCAWSSQCASKKTVLCGPECVKLHRQQHVTRQRKNPYFGMAESLFV